MSNAPSTPRNKQDRDRRRVQSTTPTKRYGADRRRMDRLAVSPGVSHAKNSFLLPRISGGSGSSVPPRPVTPSNDFGEVSKPPSTMSIIDRMPSTPPRRSYSSNRSVVSESAAIPFDEEMPDDEKLDRFDHQQLKRGLQQPFLPDNFDEKPRHMPRRETRPSKTEANRLSSLLSRARGRDSTNISNDQPQQVAHKVDAADRGGGAGIHQHVAEQQFHDDDVSSLGGIEDYASTSSSVSRLSLVLRSRLDPSELGPEEKAFWDKLQLKVAQMKIESRNKIRSLEHDLRVASEKKQEAQYAKEDLENKLLELKKDLQLTKAKLHTHGEQARGKGTDEETKKKINELERKNKEIYAQLEAQQEEHESAIRAIQRVLADVTTQRDALAEKLQEQIADLEKENSDLKKLPRSVPSNVPASDQDVETLRSRAHRASELEREMEELKSSLSTSETTRVELKQELEQKGGKVAILEQEINLAKSSLASSKEREEELSQTVTTKTAEVKELKRTIESISSGGPKSSVNNDVGDSSSHPEVDVLREELNEKRISLETAKNIIASLENANGSLTTDLRGKLKDKDEEITMLKKEMASGKRTLDNLATDLRDLQLQKKQLHETKKQASHVAIQQRALRKDLKQALSEIRSATAVHEAGSNSGYVDEGIVDQVSAVLGNVLSSLEASMTGTRALAVSSLDVGSKTKSSSVSDTNLDDEASQDSPEDMRARLSALEDALHAKTTEMEQLLNETSEKRLGWKEEEAKMRDEIHNLKDQCMTNMQVLTKKERELEVLRDSLEVSDGVGYISDDGSDGEDEEEDGVGPLVINRTMSIDSSHYSCSQAEAVATLLVQGGTGIEVTSGVSAGQFESLKEELKKAKNDKEKAAKDLKHEQEALANAKMIISSLERANKTMLEDLRSRLQDSNTAIASLLEKSSEQEKKSSALQGELDTLKEEKEKETDAHKKETQKLNDELVMCTLKLADKDREVQELLQRLQKHEASGSATTAVDGGSTEETKEESVEESKDGASVEESKEGASEEGKDDK